MSKAYLPLFLWLVVAYALCLMPAPSFWKEYFPWFASMSDAAGSDHPFWVWVQSHSNLRDWAAHVLLMAGIAFSLVRIIRRRDWRLAGSGLKASTLSEPVQESQNPNVKPQMIFAFVLTLLAIALIAVSIEWFQSLLPECFSRGSALSDVWASLMGGAIGVCLGICFGRTEGLRGRGDPSS